MLEKIYDPLLTLAYPAGCAVCNCSIESSRDGVACGSCWLKTRIFAGSELVCRKCGKLHSEKPSTVKTLCRECDKHFYDQARAVGIYEIALSVSVLRLKKEPVIAPRLRELILDSFLSSPFLTASRIIPVPLSKQRRLNRGFNQAAVIGSMLAKESGIGIDKQVLIRTKHSKIHRSGMDKKARRLTVEKSFAVRAGKINQDETIILVDDVFTSGATASICARVLKKNGAGKVFVFTIARAG